MSLDPRARFLRDGEAATQHANLAASTSFQKAVDACLLQYHARMPAINDTFTALAHAHRMEGARDFARLLLEFCELPPKASPRSTGNLNGNVQ